MTQAGAVVLVDPVSGALPSAALPALRDARAIYAGSDVVAAEFGVEQAPDADKLLAEPVVLIASSRAEPGAAALLAAGAALIESARPAGAWLVEAAKVMDRLRSPGGCPWDAVQTHDSLRQYLIEETYELLDAIEDGDRAALREELGDVLLQVLFHARVAAEHAEDPFDIDEVAGELVAKLVGRHPHVFAVAPGAGVPLSQQVHTAEHQEVKWEELKQAEKRRESIVDGIALGQPAVALAGKLGQRSGRAGIPLDLLPAGTEPAVRLFRVAATAKRAGIDPEVELHAVAKRFAEDIHAAERAARAAGVDPATLEAEAWRRYWPVHRG